MLDQKMITISKQPLTSYNMKQRWPPHFSLKLQTQEDRTLIATLAELASEKGSWCLEYSDKPELHPTYPSRLYSPSHLSIERDSAVGTCHDTRR